MFTTGSASAWTVFRTTYGADVMGLPSPIPPQMLGAAEASDPIREAVTWAGVTVITWTTIVSMALLLVRLVTRQDDRDREHVTERDAPTPADGSPEDPRNAQ